MTARIALIAYLVGGWLLPATHHHYGHGHRGQSHHHAASHSCDHAHPHGQSHSHDHASEPSRCSHDAASHSHQALIADDSQPLGWVAAEPLIGCHGLCALCSARSLKTDRATIGFVAGESLEVSRHAFSTGLRLTLPMLGGAHLSRGPPSIV